MHNSSLAAERTRRPSGYLLAPSYAVRLRLGRVSFGAHLLRRRRPRLSRRRRHNNSIRPRCAERINAAVDSSGHCVRRWLSRRRRRRNVAVGAFAARKWRRSFRRTPPNAADLFSKAVAGESLWPSDEMDLGARAANRRPLFRLRQRCRRARRREKGSPSSAAAAIHIAQSARRLASCALQPPTPLLIVVRGRRRTSRCCENKSIVDDLLPPPPPLSLLLLPLLSSFASTFARPELAPSNHLRTQCDGRPNN